MPSFSQKRSDRLTGIINKRSYTRYIYSRCQWRSKSPSGLERFPDGLSTERLVSIMIRERSFQVAVACGVAVLVWPIYSLVEDLEVPRHQSGRIEGCGTNSVGVLSL